MKFQYMAQLKYCQKLDFEGYPNNDLNYPNKKKKNVVFFSDLKINEISIHGTIRILPKIGFRRIP